jgi:hypothetical protein
MKVQMGSCGVPRVSNLAKQVARNHEISLLDRDGSILEMRKKSEAIPSFQNQVVAGQWPQIFVLLFVKEQTILQRNENVSHQVDGLSLRPSIRGKYNCPGEWSDNGLRPPVTILELHATQQVSKALLAMEIVDLPILPA